MADLRLHDIGRFIVVDFHAGERLPDAIVAIARDLELQLGTVSYQGVLAAARLELGERKYTQASADPDRVSFHDERLVIGSGAVQARGDGTYTVSLRATIGLEREVFVADVLEASVGRGLQMFIIEGRGDVPHSTVET